MRKQLFSSEHIDIVDSLKTLALIYTYQGRYLEAEKLYLEIFPILESSLGKEHPVIASTLNNLAGLYEAQGNYSQAEQKYLSSLEIQKNLLGNEHR
ncbi:MAG: tetratricopeptide repeat protein [Nostoc sp.]|uniref:tetratricopeptide repeat protein n=1 Tax=Nostoc sp. TaxID=1180 RepID=UPI002FF642EA